MTYKNVIKEIKAFMENNPNWYWEHIEKHFDESYGDDAINEKVKSYKLIWNFDNL